MGNAANRSVVRPSKKEAGPADQRGETPSAGQSVVRFAAGAAAPGAPVERTVSTLSATAMLIGVRASGIDIAALARRSGLSADILADPLRRITLREWAKLFQAAIMATDDEAIGLLGRPMAVGTFLMMARGFIHCKTIGEAMARFADFYNLLRTGMTYGLEVKGAGARFTCVIDQARPIVADFSLVTFHRLFSWLANELIELDCVFLPGGPPVYAAEYRTAFWNTPIQYGRAHHAILFRSSFGDLPIVRSEKDLEEYLARFSTAMFFPMPKSGELSRRIRVNMFDGYDRSKRLPDLEEVAADMHLRSRSLSKRLREEGMSFREIKARARRDIAIRYLNETEHSVETIAELAGFSEPSAFIRAFKGWTGATPLAYRKATASDFAL